MSVVSILCWLHTKWMIHCFFDTEVSQSFHCLISIEKEDRLTLVGEAHLLLFNLKICPWVGCHYRTSTTRRLRCEMQLKYLAIEVLWVWDSYASFGIWGPIRVSEAFLTPLLFPCILKLVPYICMNAVMQISIMKWLYSVRNYRFRPENASMPTISKPTSKSCLLNNHNLLSRLFRCRKVYAQRCVVWYIVFTVQLIPVLALCGQQHARSTWWARLDDTFHSKISTSRRWS